MPKEIYGNEYGFSFLVFDAANKSTSAISSSSELPASATVLPL